MVVPLSFSRCRWFTPSAHHNICKTLREKSILAFGRIVVNKIEGHGDHDQDEDERGGIEELEDAGEVGHWAHARRARAQCLRSYSRRLHSYRGLRPGIRRPLSI